MPPELPDRLTTAFLGELTHVELAPGEHLYKFVSIPIVRHRILFDELQIRARWLQKPMVDRWIRQRDSCDIAHSQRSVECLYMGDCVVTFHLPD